MTTGLKSVLHAIINLGGNTALWNLIPEQYKLIAVAVFNVLYMVYCFLDPTATLNKLGLSRSEYLLGIQKSKEK